MHALNPEILSDIKHPEMLSDKQYMHCLCYQTDVISQWHLINKAVDMLVEH